MSSISAIAMSGMSAAQAGMSASAGNIAAAATSAAHRRVELVAMPGGGVAPMLAQETATSGPNVAADVVGMLQSKNAFLANLAVFRSADRMAGALLDRAA